MNDSDSLHVHLVLVTMTDVIVACGPALALWVAATPRDQAAAAVARVVPLRWAVELIDAPLSAELIGRIKLAPGAVAELSSALV